MPERVVSFVIFHKAEFWNIRSELRFFTRFPTAAAAAATAAAAAPPPPREAGGCGRGHSRTLHLSSYSATYVLKVEKARETGPRKFVFDIFYSLASILDKTRADYVSKDMHKKTKS